MRHLFVTILILFSVVCDGQKNKSKTAESDSLLTTLLKDMPKERQKEFIKMYKSMSADQRTFFAALATPVSSKKELVKNIDSNYDNVWQLKALFDGLVPKAYKIYIEFKPPEKLLHLGQSVDFWCSIDSSANERTWKFQEWNVELTSAKLDTLLNQVGWDRAILKQIESALQKANCISIQNGEPTEIGFARSGMGKYFYSLFSADLTPEQVKEYNNKCEYIYYKNNIVLQYGGGAIGSDCFPDTE